MAQPTKRLNLAQTLRQIHPRQRLPIWGLRLILGAILLTFSEIIMWQNPPAHTPLEWAVRAVQYVGLAAILIDVVVRFQAHEIAALGLVSGLYGLLCATLVTVTNSALADLPLSLIVRGLGLQTGAALYGLLLFILVLRGRQVAPLEIAAAAGIGLLWGVWIKWYPAQSVVGWGNVPIEMATLYLIGGFVLVGALLLVVGPRFRVTREQDLQLLWWEWILAGAPLFLGLLFGTLNPDQFPPVPLLLVAVIIGFVIGALILQRHGFEPSILGELIITAPNGQTYVILSGAFLVAGTLGAALIGDNKESIIGTAAYVLIAAIGSLWLPAAMGIIGVRVYRRED